MVAFWAGRQVSAHAHPDRLIEIEAVATIWPHREEAGGTVRRRAGNRTADAGRAGALMDEQEFCASPNSKGNYDAGRISTKPSKMEAAQRSSMAVFAP
jgi:hypothetical protein